MSWATWMFVSPSAQSFLARSHNSGRYRRGWFGVLQFARLEELRPPLLPPVQTSATHTKVGRYPLIADTGLTERTNLLDVFLAELGRLTSASLAAGAVVLARHGRFHGAASIRRLILRGCRVAYDPAMQRIIRHQRVPKSRGLTPRALRYTTA